MRGKKLRIFHTQNSKFQYYTVGIDNNDREILLITEDFHILHTGIYSDIKETKVANFILGLNNNWDCDDVTIWDNEKSVYGRKLG